jgi:tryptophan 2-monooxygenase
MVRIIVTVLLMIAMLSIACTGMAARNNPQSLSRKLLGRFCRSAARPCEILVVDGKIAAIGKSVARPEGAKIVDLSRQFVMPGFIDAHVHLTGGSKVIANLVSLNDSALTLAGVSACEKLLNNGFTTVRDVGDFSISSWIVTDLKKAVEAGDIKGPRIVSSGHMISAVGGHFDFGGFFRHERGYNLP